MVNHYEAVTEPREIINYGDGGYAITDDGDIAPLEDYCEPDVIDTTETDTANVAKPGTIDVPETDKPPRHAERKMHKKAMAQLALGGSIGGAAGTPKKKQGNSNHLEHHNKKEAKQPYIMASSEFEFLNSERDDLIRILPILGPSPVFDISETILDIKNNKVERIEMSMRLHQKLSELEREMVDYAKTEEYCRARAEYEAEVDRYDDNWSRSIECPYPVQRMSDLEQDQIYIEGFIRAVEKYKQLAEGESPSNE